ncbi:hypothetical protein GL218_09168 [Daldinia childiae]|uniref:uncharacterized protein n=1 Tax=Daldinia childiae TaxID=326645 RepID=UPI001446F800|nr:uncharacterized protein GL218_09168 [Daldinia childiae]KAF3066338.1 hypothetical protein GL218_09168 [Daldinia childiae]
MAPVTEIVLHSLKPGTDVETFYKLFSVIKEQSGAQAVRASTVHENPEQVDLFIDWDSIESHQALQAQTEAYGAFIDQVKPHVTKLATVIHAELTPFPPTVLDNADGKGKSPVAQLIFTYFAPDTDAAKTLTEAQKFVSKLSGTSLAGLTGESSFGWTVEKDVDFKGEKTRVLIIILGWESVQAHLEARETDAWKSIIGEFQGAAEGLKGFEVTHVSTKAV